MRLIHMGLAMAMVTGPALAQDMVITHDTGGKIIDYMLRAEKMKGRKIILKGRCYSACTVYLWPYYGLDVCAMPTAMLGFHKPYRNGEGKAGILRGKTEEAFINAYWKDYISNYPAAIRDMLRHFDANIPSPTRDGVTWKFFEVPAYGLVKPCK